jgi:hypothetical protein
MARRDFRLLLGLACVAVAWAVLQATTGYDGGLAFMAPALFVAVPLLTGRYVGEDTIAGLAHRVQSRSHPAARAPRVRGHSRAPRRLLCRGGALIARSLAVRPPPVLPTA